MKTTFYILLGAVLAVGAAFFIRPTINQNTGAYVNSAPIYSATNASTTVNTTSTQVIAAGWANIAVISTGGTAVSCYLDGKTAASSSVATGAGYVIAANSHASFGPLGHDVPYVGAINCIASATTTVGIIKN